LGTAGSTAHLITPSRRVRSVRLCAHQEPRATCGSAVLGLLDLDAAVTLIRRNGFAATSVDQLCAAAGVTKGGFFHHFVSKEALGVAAAGHWLAITTPLFADADYHRAPDALARVLGYLDLRETLIDGGTDAFTCLAGTLAQEVHQSHPAIARAAEAAIVGHARTLEADVAEALADHGVADTRRSRSSMSRSTDTSAGWARRSPTSSVR
jgi:AcrR family transcriptional regulator